MTLYHQPHDFMIGIAGGQYAAENATDLFRRITDSVLNAYKESEEERYKVSVADGDGNYIPYFDIVYKRTNHVSDAFARMRNPEVIPMDTWYTVRAALWYMERTSEINDVRQTWSDDAGLVRLFGVFFGLLTEGLNGNHTADETFTFGDMALSSLTATSGSIAAACGGRRPVAFVPRMTLTIRYREESADMRRKDYEDMMRDLGRTTENLV